MHLIKTTVDASFAINTRNCPFFARLRDDSRITGGCASR
jgi:hypothetical protein